jgi:hypothetical protein
VATAVLEVLKSFEIEYFEGHQAVNEPSGRL